MGIDLHYGGKVFPVDAADNAVLKTLARFKVPDGGPARLVKVPLADGTGGVFLAGTGIPVAVVGDRDLVGGIGRSGTGGGWA
jgi:hypothetical protein